MPAEPNAESHASIDPGELLRDVASHWRALVITPLLAGGLALGASYLVTPSFTAKALFLPPQQQQSAASTALASLGSLAGLAGGKLDVKNAGDQYVAIMQSVSIADRLIQRFSLKEVYGVQLQSVARRTLAGNTRITLGKKDGLITVEFDDTDPARAAQVANAFISELDLKLSGMAVTEAQQRRAFFERQLRASQDRLSDAQAQLGASGFNGSALRAEPKAAADTYARLKSDITGAEVRIQGMRSYLHESSLEIRQATASLAALRSELAKLEQSSATTGTDSSYISRYREFKYQESLVELFAKQFELAKVDESREGAVIQIIDVAGPPDHKAKPKRSQWALIGFALAFAATAAFFAGRLVLRRSARP
jgi:uncharacterized protein involved in exopolysaccharide biosynthesis